MERGKDGWREREGWVEIGRDGKRDGWREGRDGEEES